jgi:hypothetical protein
MAVHRASVPWGSDGYRCSADSAVVEEPGRVDRPGALMISNGEITKNQPLLVLFVTDTILDLIEPPDSIRSLAPAFGASRLYLLWRTIGSFGVFHD